MLIRNNINNIDVRWNQFTTRYQLQRKDNQENLTNILQHFLTAKYVLTAYTCYTTKIACLWLTDSMSALRYISTYGYIAP